MIANSLRTRGVHFAFLFGPPRAVEREEAYRVHSAVCNALQYDDLTFRFSTAEPTARPSSKGFSLDFERKEGRGAFTVLIDNSGIQEPIRLLMTYNWPPSSEHVTQHCNMTAEAVFGALQGDWQRVLAEVRIRAQCDVTVSSGLAYMRGNVLGVSPEWVDSLGSPLTFAGVKLNVAASHEANDALANPARELSVEVLRDDPKCVYLELMSQWPRVAPSLGHTAGLKIAGLRAIEERPSVYIEEAYSYLEDRINKLAEGKPCR